MSRTRESVMLIVEAIAKLDEALCRLPTTDPDYDTRIATAIIDWAQGQPIRFITELDPEITPDVLPSLITGSI